MVLGANKNECFNLNVAAQVIPSPSEVKLLRIKIDYELKFKKRINKLCRKAFYRLHALQRIRRYLSVEKARLLASVFLCAFNPIQDEGGAKRLPTSFSPVTSTNVGISPRNFLTFSFNPFGRKV